MLTERKLLEEIRFQDCHTFLEYLIQAGHMERLSNLLNFYTIFVPTEEAFKNLTSDIKERLTKDRSFMVKVISYHIARGKHLMEELMTRKYVDTVAKDSADRNVRMYLNGRTVRKF